MVCIRKKLSCFIQMEILSVELLTNDLQGTEAFYTRQLGFEIVNRQATAVTFKAGLTLLTFTLCNGAEPVYHFAFNIPCNQLEQAYKWIEERTGIIDITPGNKIADFVNWNARSFYFYDNNGNILELIARFDLKNESTLEFCSDSILSISEIGVAVDDVKNAGDELIEKLCLPVFEKQPRLENFTALGDHHGLLIISSVNRHWYPTEKRAQKNYTGIKIRNGGKILTLQFP